VTRLWSDMAGACGCLGSTSLGQSATRLVHLAPLRTAVGRLWPGRLDASGEHCWHKQSDAQPRWRRSSTCRSSQCCFKTVTRGLELLRVISSSTYIIAIVHATTDTSHVTKTVNAYPPMFPYKYMVGTTAAVHSGVII
jgi:hypothetical protein